MDAASFSDDSPGRLVPIAGTDGRTGREYRAVAFVPDPLPEQLSLTDHTWHEVATAMQALGRVDQASMNIPNPRLLRRPSLRREAHSTSALEGTHAPFADVLEADAGGRVTPEIREILNYAEMAEAAMEVVPERPVGVGLLCDLHAQLVRGTNSDGTDAGRIRHTQVLIGPEGGPVEDARFVPTPPGDLLVAGFREWAEWLERPRQLPIVVQAAMAHYQFETLHPFHDGNGRLGRLTIVLQFMRTGHLREGLLTVSPWLESRRRQYQDALLAVSTVGDWDGWVRLFAQAIAAESESTVRRVNMLLARQAELRSLVRTAPLRGVAGRIAEDIIAYPVITPTAAASRYGVTYPAANNAVARLVELGVLLEATGRTYDRVFWAQDVIAALESAGHSVVSGF